MDPWQAFLWGGFGSLLVDGLAFVTAVQSKGHLPWRGKDQPAFGPYLAALVVRAALSAGLAAALAQSGQIVSAIIAVAVGIALPTLVKTVGQFAVSAVQGGSLNTSDNNSTPSRSQDNTRRELPSPEGE